MASYDRSASEGFVCPNCQTLNNPNAEICVSCGIHFQVYDEVKQEISERINNRQGEYLDKVHAETQQKLREDQKKIKTDFIKKLVILLITGILLIPVIWGTLKIIQHQKIAEQQFLEGNFKIGLDCYNTKDFQCAHDAFEKVYSKDKEYQDVFEKLIVSKMSIAQELFAGNQISKSIDLLDQVVLMDPQNIQALSLLNNYHKELGNEYKNQKSWQKAIDEYQLALNAMPDDFDSRKNIDEIYTSWIKEAKSDGNVLLVLKLKKLQDHFRDD